MEAKGACYPLSSLLVFASVHKDLNSAKVQPLFSLATGFTVKSMVVLVETHESKTEKRAAPQVESLYFKASLS